MNAPAVALSILLFPAAGALVLAGRGWRMPRVVTQIVGPGVVWLSFAATLWLFFNKVNDDFAYWTWIKSGTFELPFNLLVDNLSIFMCLVITGVGGLIVTYSVGYMAHEDGPSYARFFTYMDVFILIGFWYHRRAAVLAARKAFVMNVIGDVGMILGAFVLFVTYHTVTYLGVFTGVYISSGAGKLCYTLAP